MYFTYSFQLRSYPVIDFVHCNSSRKKKESTTVEKFNSNFQFFFPEAGEADKDLYDAEARAMKKKVPSCSLAVDESVEEPVASINWKLTFLWALEVVSSVSNLNNPSLYSIILSHQD